MVLAGEFHPIPFRTRPLKPPAPMVLRVNTWESRSPPGQPRTDQNYKSRPHNVPKASCIFARGFFVGALSCWNGGAKIAGGSAPDGADSTGSGRPRWPTGNREKIARRKSPKRTRTRRTCHRLRRSQPRRRGWASKIPRRIRNSGDGAFAGNTQAKANL